MLGWWYWEEDGDHFDYWIQHSLPHLLVLHDLDANVSYWARVSAAAVESTGKGNKIFVPATQTIDAEHLDDLLEIAAEQKPDLRLEGTAWTASVADLAPGQRYRFALLAPRLVAPHRNAGYETAIRPEEAIALIAEGRIKDVELFAHQHAGVPDPATDASKSSDWGWRFVGGLWAWVVEETGHSLDGVMADAPDTARRTLTARHSSGKHPGPAQLESPCGP